MTHPAQDATEALHRGPAAADVVARVLPLSIRRGSEHFGVDLAVARPPLSWLVQNLDRLLHAREMAYYASLLADRRRHSFLLGRYVAKSALLGAARDGRDATRLSQIEIRAGVFRQPVVRFDGGSGRQVSISHGDPWGAALAFPEEHPMAIDIERVEARDPLGPLRVLTATERIRLAESPLTPAQRTVVAWTAKEALSKVLKTGLTLDVSILEISAFHVHARRLECLFANFPQYRAVSWLFDGFAWSIVLPKNSHFDADAAISALHAARPE